MSEEEEARRIVAEKIAQSEATSSSESASSEEASSSELIKRARSILDGY